MPTLFRVLALLPLLATPTLAAQEDTRALPFFPIGFYELPKEDEALQRMVAAGVNLIKAPSVADLDRVQAAGAKGWMPLPVQGGATDALREQILAAKDHPALAVWEGPDEIVWTFTAYSTLKDSVGISREDWETQQPKAVAYAQEQAEIIIPNMEAGIALVRELDQRNLPFWMNEARDSDALYIRRYLDDVDVAGCDDYPMRPDRRDLMRPVRATERFVQINRGKPVWMVLQAFSWHEIGSGTEAYWPTFDESRFMAYACIAQGANGILYWGSDFLKNDDFRTSLYALTAELAAIEPFLRAPQAQGIEVRLLEAADHPTRLDVGLIARQVDNEWIIAVVNRDGYPHLGVEVLGLNALGQRPLHLLYGDETAQPDPEGSIITRLQPYQTKVFSTAKNHESTTHAGRDFK